MTDIQTDCVHLQVCRITNEHGCKAACEHKMVAPGSASANSESVPPCGEPDDRVGDMCGPPPGYKRLR